jgi:Flp pilus assembly protein TadD
MHTLVAEERVEEARQLALAGDRLRTEMPLPEYDAETADDPAYLIELADMLVRQERFGEAVTILREQFAAGALDLEGSLWLVRLLLGSGRVEEGLAFAPDVADRWPDSGRAHYLWGRALAAENQFDAALDHLRQGVVLAPGDVEIRVTLIRLRLRGGQKIWAGGAAATARGEFRDEIAQQARAAASQVAEEDYESQLVLGYAFGFIDDYERSCRHFGRAWEDRALRLDAGIQLSLCQDKLGRPESVRRTFEKLRQEFPDDPDLANTYGYWLAERGEDLELAEELVRAALAVEPGNGAFLDSLGWVYYKRERYDEAFDLLVRAVNARPDDPVILEHLGLVLKANGQPTEALAVLRRSVAAGGDSARLNPLIEELDAAAQR